MIRNTSKLIRKAMFTALTITSGATVFQTCGGGLGGYGYDWTGYGGYGYYDPTATIMSVNDYRQSVYDASNDAWDAYIRE